MGKQLYIRSRSPLGIMSDDDPTLRIQALVQELGINDTLALIARFKAAEESHNPPAAPEEALSQAGIDALTRYLFTFTYSTNHVTRPGMSIHDLMRLRLVFRVSIEEIYGYNGWVRNPKSPAMLCFWRHVVHKALSFAMRSCPWACVAGGYAVNVASNYPTLGSFKDIDVFCNTGSFDVNSSKFLRTMDNFLGGGFHTLKKRRIGSVDEYTTIQGSFTNVNEGYWNGLEMMASECPECLPMLRVVDAAASEVPLMHRSISRLNRHVHKVYRFEIEFLMVRCHMPPQISFPEALTLGFDLSCCAVWLKLPEPGTEARMICAHPTPHHEQLFARRMFQLSEGCNVLDPRFMPRVCKYMLKGFRFDEGNGGITPVTPGLLEGYQPAGSSSAGS